MRKAWITKIKVGLGLCIGLSLLLSGCFKENKGQAIAQDQYRNYYEIFVYSFRDSNGDGIGDLNGITSQLDYLTDLGINGIWLTPIMPSDSYHKYDVKDYKAIDPTFGTLEDFDKLIAACDARGINVIIDLVLNHSSSQHPWFVEAKKECETGEIGPYMDYYHFTKEPLNEEDYYPIGVDGYYYEGLFVDTMPDLNMDSEAVRKQVKDIAAFWLNRGIAGFRLDAAKHVYTEEAKNIAFWQWFVDYCKTINPEVYIVGEVWSTGSEIESYYASQINSFFNFPFAQSNGTIASAIRVKSGADFVQSIHSWQERIKAVDDKAIDATFLGNHDTDRPYGFLNQKLENQKMATSLYLMMPGNPFIYYGEEIGMLGKDLDQNKRTPMIWSVSDETGITKPAPGTSLVEPLEAGVMEQLKEENSLLKFYQRALHIRFKNPEIARGEVTPIDLGDKNLGAYSSVYNDSQIIIIHNLGVEAKSFTLSKETYGYKKVRDSLTTTKEEVTLKGESLTMPPRSTVLLK